MNLLELRRLWESLKMLHLSATRWQNALLYNWRSLCKWNAFVLPVRATAAGVSVFFLSSIPPFLTYSFFYHSFPSLFPYSCLWIFFLVFFLFWFALFISFLYFLSFLSFSFFLSSLCPYVLSSFFQCFCLPMSSGSTNQVNINSAGPFECNTLFIEQLPIWRFPSDLQPQPSH